ncbi:integrin-linked protein kinase 1-like protein [Tanacetum coccineum]
MFEFNGKKSNPLMAADVHLRRLQLLMQTYYGNVETYKYIEGVEPKFLLDVSKSAEMLSKHELDFVGNRHPNVVQFVGACHPKCTHDDCFRVSLEAIFKKKDGCHHPKALRFALVMPGKALLAYYEEGVLTNSVVAKLFPLPKTSFTLLSHFFVAAATYYDMQERNWSLFMKKAVQLWLEVPEIFLLDSGGLLKVAGIALIRLSKISPNKARLARPATIDRENLYIAPEIYKDELFDGGVDVYSFGIILYEMMEGVQPFYPKPPEEAVKLMCVDVQRPTFKTKSKYYPSNLKELIEECWYPDLSIRPKFSKIIIRLDKIVGYSSKQGWFKDTFKLPFSSLVSQSARFSLVATAPNPDLGKDKENNKQVANPVLKKSWAILLRIGQALRAVASMSRQDWAKKLVQLKTEFADTLKHYWLGIMLLGVDVKIVSRLLGASLSRTDRQQLTKLLGTVPRSRVNNEDKFMFFMSFRVADINPAWSAGGAHRL